MREDWVEVELGEVLKQSKEKHKPKQTENIFYIGLEHIEKEAGKLTSRVGVQEIKTVKNKFSKGQILYGKLRPYLNKVYLAQESGVCSTDILVFNISCCINNKYVLLYMLSRQFVNDMSANTNGVNLPRVSTRYINQYSFPLPPLPIQRAIVYKIEALFSDLDNGIANLKKAQQQLKVYRQAVLKKAFEGEFASRKLKDITLITGGVTKGKKLDGKKTYEYPYLRVANVQDGHLNLSVIKTIRVTESDFNKYQLKFEDILFTEGGDRDKLGRGTVWKSEIENCIHQNHIFRARIVSRNEICPYFITYFAQSQKGKNYFFKNGKQTTNLASINKTVLSNLPVPIPTIQEQHQIVREIESRLSVCDKVEESINQGLEKAEALRQSILKKAFEGKLLNEAEIDKCRQAADYEPASVLLERIKKEKANGK